MAPDEQGTQIHHLDLRVEVLAGDRSKAGLTVATILVDDEEIFVHAQGAEYRGWHPAQILDPYSAPLLPKLPVRRVGLYPRKSLYPAEGCITSVVLGSSDRITWSDFRDFTGYREPIRNQDPDISEGEFLPIPDLTFDAVQYQSEVARATADRWWETDEMRTARLLQHRLSQERSFEAQGWRPDFTEVRTDGYWVAFKDAGAAQLIVALSAKTGTPEQQAATMAEYLLTTPPEQWPVAFCSICSREAPDPFRESANEDCGASRLHRQHGRPGAEP